jgi:GTP cyclohydrolase I
MIDLQQSQPKLAVAINKVGVKGVKHPITFAVAVASSASTSAANTQATNAQATVATFNMYTDLAATERGTHMSRFLAILNERSWELSLPGLAEMLQVVQTCLKATNAYVDAKFTIFLPKLAPVSQAAGLVDYKIKLSGALINNSYNLKVKVTVPITTLCPCSKAISKYGAHNQRSYVDVTVATNAANLDIQQLIALVESKASCGIYSVLKREDEKFVTETAYENPKFVEDVVREVAVELSQDPRITKFKVAVTNLESIHNHAAYAVVNS